MGRERQRGRQPVARSHRICFQFEWPISPEQREPLSSTLEKMESGMQDETDAQQPELVGAAKWTAKHDATTRAATEIIEGSVSSEKRRRPV
ncbi:hypothetical protein [Chenggangzhangella methanolivorans]|uniref:Uncharacterized protein n=1 Tax=Chenggangzhangella methanolivorans TaxID=1437009 RepID=A0A9E6RBF4_9HYPH|nr:hypothetical protein [Chenggangzhangella methanolivorans]QZO01676.1 hypothetical protein K6K41_09925 [Chenggangzhangella methanolivorans]